MLSPLLGSDMCRTQPQVARVPKQQGSACHTFLGCDSKREGREQRAGREAAVPNDPGRGKHSVLGKGKAWGGAVAMTPLPRQPCWRGSGTGAVEAPISIFFLLSSEPIRTASLPPDCSSVLLICGCINSCSYYTAR